MFGALSLAVPFSHTCILCFLLPTTVSVVTETVTKIILFFSQKLKMPHIRFFNYLFVCIQSNSSIGRGETSRRRVWESKWWRSELAPLERLTCKQPRHISRAPTRDTVGKKISGEDTRGLRRSLYLYVYTIACTCTYVKEPTHESGETQS